MICEFCHNLIEGESMSVYKGVAHVSCFYGHMVAILQAENQHLRNLLQAQYCVYVTTLSKVIVYDPTTGKPFPYQRMIATYSAN